MTTRASPPEGRAKQREVEAEKQDKPNQSAMSCATLAVIAHVLKDMDCSLALFVPVGVMGQPMTVNAMRFIFVSPAFSGRFPISDGSAWWLPCSAMTIRIFTTSGVLLAMIFSRKAKVRVPDFRPAHRTQPFDHA